MNGSVPRHVPVMPAEVLAALEPAPGQVIVDATAGAGGHARLLAERVVPGGRVVALDQDPAMLDLARPRLEGLPVTFVRASFGRLRRLLDELGVERVDAVLADLGVCSDQLDDTARGLSFTKPGPLDMRMDPDSGETAAELVRRLPERELADLIYGAAAGADRDDGAAGRVGAPLCSSKWKGHRPGDARLPGTAHRRQRRASRAGPVAGRAAALCEIRRAGGDYQLSFARGPARETCLPGT